jgi:outer membrane biosynthesis protein TonB
VSGPALPDRMPTSRSAAGSAARRGLIITLLVSLGLHLAAVTAVLLFLHAGVPADDPDKPIQVELVMAEHKGDTRPAAAPQPPAEQRPVPHQTAKTPPPPVQPRAKEQLDAPQANADPAKETAPSKAQPDAAEAPPAPESTPSPPKRRARLGQSHHPGGAGRGVP